jgi:two-component system chemotaxis sensor kinase CheA
MLNNVFMHLLRNSMDHGIETPEARTAQGKTSVGAIDINVQLEEDAVRITLKDDGRGLALGRIRNIAVERGWIGRDEQTSDEEIADLIFRPGFSTAEQVTEVSGRGVGMDAVRDFLKRENGSIRLSFTDDRQGAEFRQFETVVCLPDDVAVESTGARPHREADEVSAWHSPTQAAAH